MKYKIASSISIICLFLTGAMSNVYAQGATISGTVTDSEDNSGLPGVTIQIKGTEKGTISDMNGKYSLEINENSVLVFSLIGYETIESVTSGRTVIDIQLKQATSLFGEVLITGYTSEEKGKITKTF